MRKHIIYLATDANRAAIEANYSQDHIPQFTEQQFGLYHRSNTALKLNRIIYTEEFATMEAAQKRLIEVKSFTRMQKEKLIRRNNPNWLNINTYNTSMDIQSAIQLSNIHMRAC